MYSDGRVGRGTQCFDSTPIRLARHRSPTAASRRVCNLRDNVLARDDKRLSETKQAIVYLPARLSL